METGTHSPWVSRLLTALGHEVIVAHARNVHLIVKSRRKDDRLDARTLARLARIDPELLSPVQHRSAQAQLHLMEIRARAGLVSAATEINNSLNTVTLELYSSQSTVANVTSVLSQHLGLTIP
jgi:transposase